MKEITKGELFERLVLHDKAIKKLVEVTDKQKEVIDGLVEKEKYSTQLDIVQALINSNTDSRLDDLESESLSERLEHMEEYIDKLTKRVKELESENNNKHTCGSNVCNHCGTSH